MTSAAAPVTVCSTGLLLLHALTLWLLGCNLTRNVLWKRLKVWKLFKWVQETKWISAANCHLQVWASTEWDKGNRIQGSLEQLPADNLIYTYKWTYYCELQSEKCDRESTNDQENTNNYNNTVSIVQRAAL